jgi:Cu/Ag efflux protein CusF
LAQSSFSREKDEKTMSNLKIPHFLLLALLVLSVALAACHHEPRPTERYYQLRGTVVSVDVGHKQLIVNHEAIPGFMPTMTMSYTVKDYTALSQLKAGDRISARVVATSDHDMWLDNIVVHKKGELPQPQTGAGQSGSPPRQREP